MVLDVIVPIEREVSVVPAEIDPLDADGAEEGVGLFLLQGGILQGIQRNPYHLSELFIRVIRPYKFSLVGEGLILPPFLDLILDESAVLIPEVYLLYLRFYLLDCLGDGICVKGKGTYFHQ